MKMTYLLKLIKETTTKYTTHTEKGLSDISYVTQLTPM